MEYDVRRIKPGEWREYRALRLEALKDSPLAFAEQYEQSLAQPDRVWQERVERSATGATSAMFVATCAGEFVGKVGCLVPTETTEYVLAHIVGVYVTPRLRGQGVADALFARVIQWAQDEARADRIRLFVMQTNDRAAAFYRRIGFVRTGVTMTYPPNPEYIEYEMAYVDPPGRIPITTVNFIA
jgi:ribosomal protein S18 acetylase RimI-like enzyme